MAKSIDPRSDRAILLTTFDESQTMKGIRVASDERRFDHDGPGTPERCCEVRGSEPIRRVPCQSRCLH